MHKGSPPYLLPATAVAGPRVQAPFAVSSMLAPARPLRYLLCSLVLGYPDSYRGLTGSTFSTKAKGSTVETVNTLYRKYL
jgi:hypothetical protein